MIFNIDNFLSGLFGGSSSLMSIIVSAEVCLSNGRIVSWTWEKDPVQMKSLCCGLGMIAVVLSLTIKCVPLQRFESRSYLKSLSCGIETYLRRLRAALPCWISQFPF